MHHASNLTLSQEKLMRPFTMQEYYLEKPNEVKYWGNGDAS